MPRIARGVVLGVAAGFVGGLLGVGGGVVFVPGMVLLLGVTQHVAHGTSVAAIIASASAGVFRLGLDDEVAWATAGAILVGAMVGAFAGARLASRVPALWLARAFVIVAILAAARMAFQPEVSGTLLDDRGLATGVGYLILGLGAGTLASLLGVGGGIVYVPALVALFGFEQHIAQGTSLAVIAPSMVVAAATHSRAGRVDWQLAGILGAGGIIGGFVGAEAALALDPTLLRRIFAVFLVGMTLRMARRTRRADHS